MACVESPDICMDENKYKKTRKSVDEGTANMYNKSCHKWAGVAELADALDLGSSVFDVGVRVSSPAPF